MRSTLPMAARARGSAVALTVLASLIWGTSFPGTEWGLGFVGNDLVFLWLRFVVAVVITLGVVVWLRRSTLSVLCEPAMWLIGALNAAGFILQYVGLTITTASKTALLVDINVVAVAIISYFAFAERLGRLQLLGVACGMMGVLLITLNKDLVFDTSQIIGDILVYAAGWSWAFFIVLSKKMLRTHDGVEVSSAAILSCAAWLTIPTVYVVLSGADLRIEPEAWAAALYLGLFCTSIATLLWALGLEGVSATASATIMLVEVVTALVISFALLGERLSMAAGVGAGLILLSIMMVAGTGAGERSTVKPT